MLRGKWNAITDVRGVKVGHETLEQVLPNGDFVCTGVTAILPHSGNIFEQKVPSASFVLNGFGKTAGLIQIEELGIIESPISSKAAARTVAFEPIIFPRQSSIPHLQYEIL